jgi:pimeloyl-ACP methyl ester carboxylesterase
VATALLILHGLVAVALLGAITHQTLAAWAPSSACPGSFFGHFRAVQPAGYSNAIVGLYVGTALLGAVVYADGHDMDHYADDLAALTAHLDLKNAIHVGHSTGGGEAAHYLARHGEVGRPRRR